MAEVHDALSVAPNHIGRIFPLEIKRKPGACIGGLWVQDLLPIIRLEES